MVPLRTVALLGREAGLALLRDGLLRDPRLRLACVAAHSKLPRGEDPARGARPEFPAIRALCDVSGAPLVAVDTPAEASDLDFLEPCLPVDLVCAVSWRYVVSPKGLARARLGFINLHRGRLPEFAGAEPVKRMIENGLHEAEITAHLMVAEVDSGPVLATVRLPIEPEPGLSPAQLAEKVKAGLVPLYAPLLHLAVTALLARKRVPVETGR